MGASETVWQRGWRDAKSAWADWRFWGVELIIGSAIGGVVHWVAGLIAVVAIAFCVWLGATAAAPFRIAENERRRWVDAEKKLTDFLNEKGTLKEKIRVVLEEANPAIIDAIDGGQHGLYVKLRPGAAERLLDLQDQRQSPSYFAEFVAHQFTDIASIGSRCRADLSPIEDLRGGTEFRHFSFKPTDLLKNENT